MPVTEVVVTEVAAPRPRERDRVERDRVGWHPIADPGGEDHLLTRSGIGEERQQAPPGRLGGDACKWPPHPECLRA